MRRRIGYLVSIAVISIFVLGVGYYNYVLADQRVAQQNALSLAKEKYDIKDVQELDYYHGSFAGFQVIEATVDDQNSYLFVPMSKKKSIRIVSAKTGWSREQVKQYVKEKFNPHTVVSIRIGLEKHQTTARLIPVWEVVYKAQGAYTFHYLRFTDGTLLKTYTIRKSGIVM